MGFIAFLTQWINSFLSKSTVPMLPSIPRGNDTSVYQRERETPIRVNNRDYHPVTTIRNVTANFYSTGAIAWKNQPGGQHYGTDFSANAGTPVFLPFDGKLIARGYYADTGRMGDYLIFTLEDNAELYLGHLDDPISVPTGTDVKAGTIIGKTNEYNHTHVQLRLGGQLSDFEAYERQYR